MTEEVELVPEQRKKEIIYCNKPEHVFNTEVVTLMELTAIIALVFFIIGLAVGAAV